MSRETGKVDVSFRMDQKSVEKLEAIARLAGVSVSTAVNVMLATFVLTTNEATP